MLLLSALDNKFLVASSAVSLSTLSANHMSLRRILEAMLDELKENCRDNLSKPNRIRGRIIGSELVPYVIRSGRSVSVSTYVFKIIFRIEKKTSLINLT